MRKDVKGPKQTPEHIAKRQASRKANHIALPEDKQRRYYLNKVYGITLEEYYQIYEDQDGRCAICGILEEDLETRFCVDHDHETGRVRGLLCRHCNWTILPRVEHNRESVLRALAYLEGAD